MGLLIGVVDIKGNVMMGSDDEMESVLALESLMRNR